MSEDLVRYAVKASQVEDCHEEFNLDLDLVQLNFLWQALPVVVTTLKFSINAYRQRKIVFVNKEDSFTVNERIRQLQIEQRELKLSENEFKA